MNLIRDDILTRNKVPTQGQLFLHTRVCPVQIIQLVHRTTLKLSLIYNTQRYEHV